MDDSRRRALEWFKKQWLQAANDKDRELLANLAFPRY
jgi:hypothetical protein